MGRRFVWLSLAALGGVGCQERLTAPGACPEFCPSTLITVVDSVVGGTVVRDSSFRGYVTPHRAPSLQLGGGGGPVAHAVTKFVAFSDRIQLVPGDSTTGPVVAIDSFRVRLTVRRRPADVTGLELVIHRLTISVDSLTTFDALEPLFDDSTVIGNIAVPDTVGAADTVAVADTVVALIPGDAFPTLQQDSLRAAIGVELRAPQPAYLDLGAIDVGLGAVLTRFVQVDSAGIATVARSDTRTPQFDTFVTSQPVDSPTSETLLVGGVPSARALLRIALPPGILDSADIVRATLLLVPDGPVAGVPGDTLIVRAEVLAADFGPKSPIITVPADLLDSVGAALVPVGSVDSIEIDVTHILRPWRLARSAPRSLMLRVTPEGARLGELRFRSSRSAAPPSVRLTYVPLFEAGR